MISLFLGKIGTYLSEYQYLSHHNHHLTFFGQITRVSRPQATSHKPQALYMFIRDLGRVPPIIITGGTYLIS